MLIIVTHKGRTTTDSVKSIRKLSTMNVYHALQYNVSRFINDENSFITLVLIILYFQL